MTTYKLKSSGITVYTTGRDGFDDSLIQVTKNPGSNCVFSVQKSDLVECETGAKSVSLQQFKDSVLSEFGVEVHTMSTTTHSINFTVNNINSAVSLMRRMRGFQVSIVSGDNGKWKMRADFKSAKSEYIGKRVEFNDDTRGEIIGEEGGNVHVMLDGDGCRVVWVGIDELADPKEKSFANAFSSWVLDGIKSN